MSLLYENPLSVTSQFSFCGLPFRLDTYSGCGFSCTYCFARLRGGNVGTQRVRIADPNAIINRFKNALIQDRSESGIITEFIKTKMPVHFGGMSDPFQPIENVKKVSLCVLKYLSEINYPVIISTKSLLVSKEPYLSILKSNPNVLVQFSLSTTLDEVAKITEPFSTPPTQLLKAAELLSAHGVKTSVRWQPYIPSVSEDPLKFIHRISSIGIRHLGFEHLKLPVEKNNPLIYQLFFNINFDLKKFYKEKNCVNDGREFILPSSEKIAVVLHVKSELANKNITFGAADNDLQYLSDTSCCCSGADQFEGFENWNKFQIAHAVKKSNGKFITFDLIKDEWFPKGAIDKHLNSKSRILKKNSHNTVFDYIVNRWENLDSPFNPVQFYKVEYNGKRDENGIRIFEWSL